MTEYIEPEDVDELVEDEGFHYRDRNGLLSALASPMPVFGEEVYPRIHQKAAALISAINHNHPLLDGNKRLSWFVTVAFYDINGYDLRAGAEDADRYIRLIAGANPPPLHDVELWLDKHTTPLD
ncbi:type II toxin-antitoxin system death-on-curing family toxin [Microbacterium sp. dk485]|uniref:type II toxin-antitoxin system death-on-curing family toxin n=1 Tax=Microbacterium sp. dk485 TaxID=2560021 RepID=UPI001073D602|nr:Fic family protein [Microbacterium sp. dk485]TFV81464.1 type II toxin-antitoxin system death-on-curing family toxin [Microbacterium sp. dk485]